MRKLGLVLLAILVLALPGFSQDSKLPRAQREVVEAERAFARYCVANGIRDAWLEFFTDDGVIFQPGPVNAKEFHRKRPPATKPLKFTLDWEPRWGDVSRAGDLGYNIGPWNIIDNTPAKEPDVHGYYMSVWRKQADGKWKVALDFGTGGGMAATSDHVFGKPFQPAVHSKIKVPAGSNPAKGLEGLTEIERGFVKNALSAGALDTYLSQFSEDVKVMRAGLPPAGREIVRSYIPAGKDVSLTFVPDGGGVATSNDLGYTYGSYELQEGGQTKEKGCNIEEVKPKKTS